jgi:hypothetical protein
LLAVFLHLSFSRLGWASLAAKQHTYKQGEGKGEENHDAYQRRVAQARFLFVFCQLRLFLTSLCRVILIGSYFKRPAVCKVENILV